MSLRILLVEDESRIADLLCRGLGEEGYAVQHASDGRQAWSSLQSGTWDAVILDWWLPGEDGLSLLKRFRHVDQRTPVLFLTARASVPERVIGLNAGADDYLSKPFSFAELLARLNALLRRQRSIEDFQLQFADICVDLRRQQASRAEHPLDLTAKELRLLTCFLNHPQTVLSRSRLYEAVWGDDLASNSNTLEVHIRQLRQKLEQFGPRLIHTRRGRGYVLDVPATQEA